MQIQKGPLHSFGAAVPFAFWQYSAEVVFIICTPGKSADHPGVLFYGRGAAEYVFLIVCYFRSNLTTTSRYHRYGTMFQIIQSSIRR